MHGTITDDIFKEIQKTLTEYNLDWNRLQCVIVDGGKNMSGIKICLVSQITRACEDAGFFCGVDNELNVTQELASLHSMHDTITDDIFKEIQKTLTEYNLDWNRLQCVIVDGGKTCLV
ncbi:hypothetical protein B7P43_G16155 [Cryptotermes secundus]|uniref:Uncharacterized protein n=1 Tax=Cryptotermes secundus TaxID=105785 RepID=A0A2J7R4G9_9NEOP|nr:hypothetical protein B7P43_G16155 [Cryptotermes secundus]